MSYYFCAIRVIKGVKVKYGFLEKKKYIYKYWFVGSMLYFGASSVPYKNN